jgi:hypothetical protein
MKILFFLLVTTNALVAHKNRITGSPTTLKPTGKPTRSPATSHPTSSPTAASNPVRSKYVVYDEGNSVSTTNETSLLGGSTGKGSLVYPPNSLGVGSILRLKAGIYVAVMAISDSFIINFKTQDGMIAFVGFFSVFGMSNNLCVMDSTIALFESNGFLSYTSISCNDNSPINIQDASTLYGANPFNISATNTLNLTVVLSSNADDLNLQWLTLEDMNPLLY